MKFQANRGDLLRALQIAMKAVHPRPILPMYSNILLESDTDNVRLSSTNFEISVRVNIPNATGQKFSTCVPGKLLTDLISTIQDTGFKMSYNSQKEVLMVETKRSKNTVRCIDPADFVATPSIKNAMVKLDVAHFKQSISRVSFCARTGDDQSVLSGVLLKLENGKLILCAVDGLHLAYDEISVPKKYTKKEQEAIIKASTLDTVGRILDDEGDVSIEISGNQVIFNSENTVVVVQRLDGKFIDYSQILKASSAGEISCEVETLSMLEACKLVSLFSEDNKAHLETSGMLAKLSTTHKDKGEGKMEVVATNSGEISVNLSVVLLKQFLEVCSEQMAILNFEDAYKPIMLTMKDNDAYKHIIMPIA